VVPTLADAYTARFSVTAAEWTALTATPAATLSVAARNTLRAQAWSSGLPLLPPPDWVQATKPVFTTSTYPVEVRESLASLAAWLPTATTAARPLYEVPALALAASAPPSGAEGTLDQLLTARFQALPFADPATGLAYARARWYDAETGSWLTADPLGYVDSSNLYAFAGGDPVNGRDPRGLIDGSDTREDFRQKENEVRRRAYEKWCKENPKQCRESQVRGQGMVRMVGGGLQVAGGVAVGASTGPLPEPVTKTIAGINIVRGADTFGAGFMELVTGKEHDTASGHALKKVLTASGVAPKKAATYTRRTEMTVDIVAGLAAGGASAYNGWRTAVISSARVGSAEASLYTSTRPVGEVFPELVGVNPYYAPGAGAGVNTNCASCVNAATLRLLGNDANAIAEPSGAYASRNALLPSAPYGHLENQTIDEVIEQMAAAGDGAVGSVIVPQGNGIEHALSVVNRGGAVYFVDPQAELIVTMRSSQIVHFGRR
jgi:RHS repeat-associated protein